MSTTKVIATEQGRQEAELLNEMVAKLEKTGVSFAELDTKVQKHFTEQAKEIMKLNDSIESVRADYANRFAGLTEDVQRGNYRGHFASRQHAEQFGRAFAAVLQQDAAKIADMQKAAVLGESGAGGGYLANEQLLPGIVRNVENYGVFEADCPATPTTTLKGRVAKRSQGATIYYPDLQGEPTDSVLKFASAEFSLTRWSGIVLVDRWFLASELAVALAEYVVTELGYALALAQDTNFFMGDGADTYARITGIFKSVGGGDLTAVSGDNTFQEVIDKTVVYLAQLAGGMPDWVDAALKLYMHRSIFWQYMGVRDSQNRPIANVLLGTSGKPERQILGYPVRITQVGPKLADSAASTAMLVAANLRDGARLMRHRTGTEIRQSEHWKFASGQLALAIDVLQDMIKTDTNAWGRLITNAA